MKSINPLKLYGTYLGLLLGLVGSYFSFAIVLHYAEQGTINFLVFLIPTIPFLTGGLIGYLLHFLIKISLFRSSNVSAFHKEAQKSL